MLTLSAKIGVVQHKLVTTSTVHAAPPTESSSPPAPHPSLAPGAFVVMAVVVVLLGWSFRVLGRTMSELVVMFRVLANVALTAVLLVGALAAIAAWVFMSAAG